MSSTGSITVSGRSVQTYHADRQVLRFRPPLEEHALDPARFDYAWRLLQFCFEFPEPRAGQPATSPLQGSDAIAVNRFIDKARSLASSPFLAHPTSLDVRFGADDEDVTASFPHEESERGFMTLLRQFANEGETASFKVVQTIAIRDDSEHGRLNEDLLRGWGKYHKKLLARTPDVWAEMKAFPRSPPNQIAGGLAPRVDSLLRTYFYGDIIHFGEGRDELMALSADTFSTAYNRMLLYKGVSGLAMYYMGYAELLSSIYGTPS